MLIFSEKIRNFHVGNKKNQLCTFALPMYTMCTNCGEFPLRKSKKSEKYTKCTNCDEFPLRKSKTSESTLRVPTVVNFHLRNPKFPKSTLCVLKNQGYQGLSRCLSFIF